MKLGPGKQSQRAADGTRKAWTARVAVANQKGCKQPLVGSDAHRRRRLVSGSSGNEVLKHQGRFTNPP